MGHEVNMDSIRALEKQIEEGHGDIIKLKRARNSLRNISTRVPPEILGDLFAWCLVRGAGRSLFSLLHFKGVQRRSYNFLLVCHHWFEVASRTPELLQEWKKYHHRWAGTAPLDLVLDGDKCDPGVLFDGSLQDAVRIGVTRDTIRQIHLASDDSATLSSIISSSTPDDNNLQNENVESTIWRKDGFLPIDISNFFARSRLSKLRFLELNGNLRIPSWDSLASRTTLLTTLSLEIFDSSPPPIQTPTTSHVFSILSSNPNLRERHLELLLRLILPGTLDEMYITGFDPTVEEISQDLGPCMQDYFRRGTVFQDGLDFSSYSTHNFTSISVAVARTQTTGLAPRVTLAVVPDGPSPPDVLEQLFANLIVPIPRERVVSFVADANPRLPEELYFTMPNIKKVYLFGVELSEGFLKPNPDGPRANTKLFPSLRLLCLQDVDTEDSNWGHFIAYLVHQTSRSRWSAISLVCPQRW